MKTRRIRIELNVPVSDGESATADQIAKTIVTIFDSALLQGALGKIELPLDRNAADYLLDPMTTTGEWASDELNEEPSGRERVVFVREQTSRMLQDELEAASRAPSSD